MPMYEYRCGGCRKRFTVLFRSFSDEKTVVCGSCGSADVARLISTFAVVRSEESRIDEMGDPTRMGDVDESDPRSMARWMRKMSSEMGEDMGPAFGEMVDRLEAGESPESMGLPGDGGGLGGGDLD